MRTLTVLALAVAVLAGWQAQHWDSAGSHLLVRTAYEDSVQRYQSDVTLRQAASPRRAQPLADAGDSVGVDNARLAEGAEATGVETNYRTAEAEGTGVETNYRTAEAEGTGVDNARMG